ncbi:MAG: hypothetical protein AB7V26_04905 [Lysobacterales bacterium]
MNWKIVLFGGLGHYFTLFVLSMLTAMVTHEGMLKELYQATAAFWRPELRSDPPDMAALMPMWIGLGLLGSLVTAGVYDVFRKALHGPGWRRGLLFGITLGLLYATLYAGMYGVFDLPAFLWLVWAVEGLVLAAGGAVLGLIVDKLD